MGQLTATLLVVIALASGAIANQRGQAPPTPTPPPAVASAFDVVWTQAIEGTADVFVVPAAHAVVIAGSASMSAWALADGRELWTWPAQATSAPAVLDEAVALLSQDHLQSIDLETGRIRWTSPVDQGTIAVASGAGLWFTWTKTTISAWSPEGHLSWRVDAGAPIASGVVVVGTSLILTTEAPEFVALDLADGTVRWRRPSPVRTGPLTVSGDRVFFSGTDGALYGYRINGSARPSWRFPIVDAVGRATADDQHVYFTLIDNSLRAFDRRGGTQRWSRTLPSRAAAGPLRMSELLVVVLTTGDLLSFPLTPGSHGPPPMSTTRVVAADKARVQVVASAQQGTWIFTVVATGDGERVLAALKPHVKNESR